MLQELLRGWLLAAGQDTLALLCLFDITAHEGVDTSPVPHAILLASESSLGCVLCDCNAAMTALSGNLCGVSASNAKPLFAKELADQESLKFWSKFVQISAIRIMHPSVRVGTLRFLPS